MTEVKNYEDLYVVSGEGHIYRKTKLSKPLAHRKGKYPVVNLSRNGITERHQISRLVYETLIGPLADGEIVAHKDGNTQNNHPNNLFKTTREGHFKWKAAQGHMSLKHCADNARMNRKNGKHVIGTDEQGQAVHFASISEAARAVNGTNPSIRYSINHNTIYRGFRFSFAESN